MGKTRRVGKRTKTKAKILNVDSPHKIKEMEKLAKNGSLTFILIYAEWCGACKRFMKNIWNPSCNTSARHQRIAIREDMVKNTSLANANFKYLPSLILVDEKGQMQTFKTPEGDTNAMPTPKNKEELNRIVNVPVLPAAANAAKVNTPGVINTKAEANSLGVVNAKVQVNNLAVVNAKAQVNTLVLNNTRKAKNARINNTRLNNTRVNNTRVNNNRVNNTRVNKTRVNNTRVNNTRVNNTRVNNTRVNNNRVNNTRVNNTLSTNVLTTKVSQNKLNNSIPDGKVYIPTPQVAPANAKQKGGANALPAAILGSLSMLLRGKTRRYKGKRQ